MVEDENILATVVRKGKSVKLHSSRNRIINDLPTGVGEGHYDLDSKVEIPSSEEGGVMSAAGSPEQSAKRVVSKCGLIGLSAAVSHRKRQKNLISWLRGERKICIEPTRIPKCWMDWCTNGSDSWDAMQYALLQHKKNKKRNKNG